jgi:hypothetical protein
MTTTQPSRHIDRDPKGHTMKPSDLEEVRHAMNRLRAKASEGVTMQTSTVMNETAIVMDAVYRADREALTAAPASDTDDDAIIAWCGTNGAEWRRKDNRSPELMTTPREYRPVLQSPKA